jgi:DNA-binding beta-propeller fold protein YncE
VYRSALTKATAFLRGGFMRKVIAALFAWLVLVVAFSAAEAATPSFDCTYAFSFGGYGSGDGKFDDPKDVAIDRTSYNVYVMDKGNGRVQKFDRNGNFITKWGSALASDGLFHSNSIAVDSATGNVYVPFISSPDNRIEIYSSEGAFLGTFGSFGAGPCQFGTESSGGPVGIVVGNGRVYAVDKPNHHVDSFTLSGGCNGAFGTDGSGTSGTAAGWLGAPWGIGAGSGYVYVTDPPAAAVQMFDEAGNSIKYWGSSGSGLGQFGYPQDVAVDRDGYVYVAESHGQRVQIFSQFGDYVTLFGQYTLKSAFGIDVNSDYEVYVADSEAKQIHVFYPPDWRRGLVPDLTFTKLAVPKTLPRNGKFPVTAHVSNIGVSDASSSQVKIYLSAKRSIDLKKDKLLATRTLSKIAVGKKLALNLKLKIPAKTKAGKYYIAARVEYTGPEMEATLVNNEKFAASRVAK